jgi:hypothetical protein
LGFVVQVQTADQQYTPPFECLKTAANYRVVEHVLAADSFGAECGAQRNRVNHDWSFR